MEVGKWVVYWCFGWGLGEINVDFNVWLGLVVKVVLVVFGYYLYFVIGYLDGCLVVEGIGWVVDFCGLLFGVGYCVFVEVGVVEVWKDWEVDDVKCLVFIGDGGFYFDEGFVYLGCYYYVVGV